MKLSNYAVNKDITYNTWIKNSFHYIQEQIIPLTCGRLKSAEPQSDNFLREAGRAENLVVDASI